jgi:hypothetical protein
MMLNSTRGAMGLRGSSGRSLRFHAIVVTIGLVIGGTLQGISRQFLPSGPAKEFLTAGLSFYLEPQPLNLILLRFTLGPLALDISLVSLLGLLLAYLIARSLF